MDKSSCLHIGSLVKLYGYKGEFVLALNESFQIDIEKWESVFIEIDGLLVPFFIENLVLTQDLTAIISFIDLTSEIKAKKFLNFDVYQSKALVNEPQKYDYENLKGYNVIDKRTKYLGKVENIVNYNQNLLLRIINENKEIFVPLVDNIITKINHKKKEIKINAPDGLLDLND